MCRKASKSFRSENDASRPHLTNLTRQRLHRDHGPTDVGLAMPFRGPGSKSPLHPCQSRSMRIGRRLPSAAGAGTKRSHSAGCVPSFTDIDRLSLILKVMGVRVGVRISTRCKPIMVGVLGGFASAVGQFVPIGIRLATQCRSPHRCRVAAPRLASLVREFCTCTVRPQ
jgi:hypothetical protein